jgi:hypothetical protein
VLTRDEVIRLAEEEGLGAHANDLIARVRPGWRLDLDFRSGAEQSAASKIGGHPDLAEDESWPHNRRGVPMVFLAQIDASKLPELDPAWPDPHPWAHRGQLIRVFADLLDNPAEPGPAVVLACDPAVPLIRTEAPPVPDPWPPGGGWDDLDVEDRFRVLPEAVVRPRTFLSAPETHPMLKPEQWDFSEQADRYESFAARLRVNGGETHPGLDLLERGDFGPSPPSAYELHHLLGEACSIQDDVRSTGVMLVDDPYWSSLTGMPPDPALSNEDAWRVLLALHYDERIGLHIHDGGAFHVLAPVTDLAEGRYERVVCLVYSG